ncbi:isocitrate dehydrogenase (NAD(+)) idh1 [Nowakowskiella sp. JEL0078]|nr:isocitrate dehydrogenase (NAD(+)) idh1 [Nowakowskiella sp. JEL0078]
MLAQRAIRNISATSFSVKPSVIGVRAFGSLHNRTALPGAERHNSTGTVYAGRHTITLIPGDGVGSEIASSVKTLFKALNIPVEFEQFDISGHIASDAGLVKEALDSIKRNKVALKGILYTPTEKLGHISFNGVIRKDLDIYASVASIANMQGDFQTRHKNVDFVIVRENTEGEYAGLEHSVSYFLNFNSLIEHVVACTWGSRISEGCNKG